jgi:hypothetical protein
MHKAQAMVWLILALLGTGSAQALNFSFPFMPGWSDRDGPPGPPPWQFRPWDMSNARGIPPGYRPQGQAQGQGDNAAPNWPQSNTYQGAPGYPFTPGLPTGPGYQPGPGYQGYGYPPGGGYRSPWPAGGSYQSPWANRYGQGYQEQTTQRAARAPRLEIELGDRQPYVQENVLVKLRVVSDQNLETANPELPDSNDFLLQYLQGPTARSRVGTDGQQEIVNEFVYTLTPLHAGDIELPAIKVTGSTAGGGYYGQSTNFKATTQPVTLQVRPAMASVQPWLPLQHLELKATLDGNGDVQEGKPVTLALELSASGATGAQLPSLEPWLKSKDFRVYREQTLTSGKLSADRRHLEGKRTEYYTLVPHSGGKLHLPEIRLPWWNVVDGTREYASLPIHMLEVDGDSGPFGLSTSAGFAGDGMSWFWIPLLGLGLLLLGYWGGVWYRGYREKHPRQPGAPSPSVRRGLRAAAATAVTGFGSALVKLDPTPALGRLKPRLYRLLPASTRFLMCVRAANREPNPVAWCQRFQETTHRQLRFAPQAPLSGVAARIIALRPSADPVQIRRLLQQLDAALYGHQDIDFARWKRQLGRQVGRGRDLLRRGPRRKYLRRPRLPELNPRPIG